MMEVGDKLNPQKSFRKEFAIKVHDMLYKQTRSSIEHLVGKPTSLHSIFQFAESPKGE